MLTQHYSPNTPITLFDQGGQPNTANERDAVIYTSKPEASAPDNTFWLSESGELQEIAHNLFNLIQKLDQQAFKRLHIELAKDSDLGVAINDRLRRAAAKRTN